MEVESRPINETVEVARLRREIREMSRVQEELKREVARLREALTQQNGERVRQVTDNVNNDEVSEADAGNENRMLEAAQVAVTPGELGLVRSAEQGIRKAGEVLQLLLLPSVAGILSTSHVDKVVVIIVAVDLAAICYIEKCITIQLDYDPDIVERLRQSTEQCRIRET